MTILIRKRVMEEKNDWRHFGRLGPIGGGCYFHFQKSCRSCGKVFTTDEPKQEYCDDCS